MLVGRAFSYEGSVYRIRRASFLPRPIQRPRIPIWVAGMWPNQEPFRQAARWDGVFPIAVHDGEPQLALQPHELRDVLAAIRHHGQVAPSYEVVVLDAGGAPADFERAGATWLLDSDEGGPGWEDRTLGRVRAGPPCPDRSRSTARVEGPLHQQREELFHGQMAFLDVCRDGRRHPDRGLGEGASVPPDAPVRAITRRSCDRARSAARTTLAELPLVEIAMSTSPAARAPPPAARRHLRRRSRWRSR